MNEYEDVVINGESSVYFNKYTRMLNKNKRNLETASKYYKYFYFSGLEIYYTINATSISSFSIENNTIEEDYTILIVSIVVPIGFFICLNFWSLLCWCGGGCCFKYFRGNQESIGLRPAFRDVPLWFILIAGLTLGWIFPFIYLLYKICEWIKILGDKCKGRHNRRDLNENNYQPRAEETKEIEEIAEDYHLEEEKEAINPLPVLFCPNFTDIKTAPNHEAGYSNLNDGNMALPVIKEKEVCVFCLNSMDEDNENIKKSEGGHKFHFDGFSTYVKVKAKRGRIACALCRKEVNL